MEGNFLSILDKQSTAFFRTVIDTLLVKATSIIVSATEFTSTSGTIVAIVDRARDWAGSFLDLKSDYME